MVKTKERITQFINNYAMLGMTAPEAYIKAGYTGKNARINAYQIIHRPKIYELIQAKMLQREQRQALTVDYIRDELNRIKGLCENKNDLTNTLRCIELLGKTCQAFSENININNSELEKQISAETKQILKQISSTVIKTKLLNPATPEPLKQQ